MKIAVGSDQRGYDLKQRVAGILASLGHEVLDMGTQERKPCDYTDAGYAVARAVVDQRAERGILLCGSGIGMSITANKVKGIRAALCHDELTAQLARRHNNANVLWLPADLIGEALTQSIVRIWLETEFEGGRHARRVAKLTDIEEGREPRAGDCG